MTDADAMIIRSDIVDQALCVHMAVEKRFLAPFAKAVLDKAAKMKIVVRAGRSSPLFNRLWKATSTRLRLYLLTHKCHVHFPGAGYDNIDLKAWGFQSEHAGSPPTQP